MMILPLLAIFFFLPCNAMPEGCSPSSCGHLQNISYPFYLKGDQANCGDSPVELACEQGNQTVLHFNSTKFYVEEISYNNSTIRVVDSGLQRDNCSSLPRYSQTDDYSNYVLDTMMFGSSYDMTFVSITIVSCSVSIDNPSYIPTAPCTNDSSLYVLMGAIISDLLPHCNIIKNVQTPLDMGQMPQNITYLDLHNWLLMGFKLHWCVGPCPDYYSDSEEACFQVFQSPHCFFVKIFSEILYILTRLYINLIKPVGYILIGRTSIGIICLSAFLIYKLRRKHLSMDDTIEEFLMKYRSHIPTRFSYSDIRKMTSHFKEKLGQGGFGSVFKGKLPNGHIIAVKMLGKSKGNGQDFINEVATIGRIHHVNVVQLIGFCSEGSKRALIYDFMPNGSLEKYIFPQPDQNHPLTWEKMYEVALGIARGIEYLHRGCDMRILHFDIKPHNILLDETFTPKVSDFGLAKFYPTDESIVSVTSVRGTIGYIAPELFYRNVGGVSYKSDVYSFGMLLMEMVGRRKNVDPVADNSSKIYFPSWIYDRLDQGGDIEIGDATEDEMDIAKKMIIIALWCIQMKPVDRPSMSKVVQMLEGSADLLQMPPKPFLSSPERISDEDRINKSDSTRI